jgi:hypothetical protein
MQPPPEVSSSANGCLKGGSGCIVGSIGGAIIAAMVYSIVHPSSSSSVGEPNMGWGLLLFFIVIPVGALIGGIMGAFVTTRAHFKN